MSHRTDLERPSPVRVEAFSDGVFAIIITLLVLEIKVPHLHNAFSGPEAWEALKGLSPKFLSFAVSFFYIAIFWVNHHHFFLIVAHLNRGLMWLNNLVLFFCCIVPFPTALIGDYPENSVALAVFAVVLFFAAVAFNMMIRYAIQHDLLAPHHSHRDLKLGLKRGLAGPILYAVAAVMAFISPGITWAIFIAIPILYLVPIKWQKAQ
jgi:uncharacterized membrane protein